MIRWILVIGNHIFTVLKCSLRLRVLKSLAWPVKWRSVSFFEDKSFCNILNSSHFSPMGNLSTSFKMSPNFSDSTTTVKLIQAKLICSECCCYVRIRLGLYAHLSMDTETFVSIRESWIQHSGWIRSWANVKMCRQHSWSWDPKTQYLSERL